MAWAQNLLGFCFFACASQARFSWVLSGGLRAFKSYVAQRFALLEATFFLCFYLYLVGSKSNVSAFFWLRFRMAWAPFSWVWPGGLQASKSYVAQRFALRFRMAWARFVIVVERWGIWRWRPSMGLLPLCAPVGTASPKAPRACFSWKLPATVTKLNYIKFKVYRQWDSHIRVASSCTIWKAADSTTFGCLVFLGWHDWPSVCCWLVGIDPLGWASTQKGWSIPETCLPSPKHCFDRPHPTLLSPLLGVGGMGGSPSIRQCRVVPKAKPSVALAIGRFRPCRRPRK